MLDLHDLEKGAAASSSMLSSHCSGASPMNSSAFSVGEKVRYWSQRHHRWVDAHVQRVNRGPGGGVISYDLTAKAQAEVFKVRDASTPSDAPAPPQPFNGEASLGPGGKAADEGPPAPEAAQAHEGHTGKPPDHFEEGERVEYWSTSACRWVPAKMLRLNAESGQCDLDLKPGAPLGRVRKATGFPPGAALTTDVPAWPSAGPKNAKIAPPPPLSCGFKVGDQVQYWSETKTRWLEAVVQDIREKDGAVVYDLDCKKGTPADRVRPSLVASQNRYQVGEEVEYWSTSAGRWLPAKVLHLYAHLGQCDLDVKPGAPLGRLRRLAGSVVSDLPPPDDQQMSPTSSADPGHHDTAGGSGCSAPQQARNDPLQLNQLLKESETAGERQAAKELPVQPPPCVGEWRNGTKTMRISESGERLLVDMGPLTPTLVLVAMTADDQSAQAEPWPKQWLAVRKSNSGRSPDAKRALYILELLSPESDRLLVKRPIGEGQVEFMRACCEELAGPNPQSGSDGPSDPSPPSRARSRSPRRQ
mmetsp:Transcript_44183/g.127820  ORF Transcript_44183/g.127820 Transcript_44183/m.127820 type:complete len:529 (-) Transcript_44183:225-1811(-)